MDFAIIASVGIMVHGVFAECPNRAPALVVDEVSGAVDGAFPAGGRAAPRDVRLRASRRDPADVA